MRRVTVRDRKINEEKMERKTTWVLCFYKGASDDSWEGDCFARCGSIKHCLVSAGQRNVGVEFGRLHAPSP